MAFKMTTTPWDERGDCISGYEASNGSSWESVWPEIDASIDIVQSAADFYTLEALATGYAFPIGMKLTPYRMNTDNDENFFQKFGLKTAKDKNKMLKMRDERIAERSKSDPTFQLRILMGKAEIKLEELVDRLDSTFFHYGHMAVGGELRHHSAVGILSGSRSSAWCGWRKVHEKLGSQALLDAATLFYDFGRGNVAYGGKKWAVCAETVHAREVGTLGPDGPDGQINKRMFIDRMFTLEHNGGSFLNKINWGIHNKRGWSLGYIKHLLNAHAACPTNWRLLLSVTSPEVYEHFTATLNATAEYMAANGMEPVTADDYFNKTYKMCKGCRSNPENGHHINCKYVKHYANGEGDQYIREFSDDDFIPHQWSTPKHQLPFTAEGTFNESFATNAQIEVKVTMELAWQKEGGPSWGTWTKHSTTKKGTLDDTSKLVLDWEHYGKARRAEGWEPSTATLSIRLMINGQKIATKYHYLAANSGALAAPCDLIGLFKGETPLVDMMFEKVA